MGVFLGLGLPEEAVLDWAVARLNHGEPRSATESEWVEAACDQVGFVLGRFMRFALSVLARGSMRFRGYSWLGFNFDIITFCFDRSEFCYAMRGGL